jgi:hypothetical protein
MKMGKGWGTGWINWFYIKDSHTGQKHHLSDFTDGMPKGASNLDSDKKYANALCYKLNAEYAESERLKKDTFKDVCKEALEASSMAFQSLDPHELKDADLKRVTKALTLIKMSTNKLGDF